MDALLLFFDFAGDFIVNFDVGGGVVVDDGVGGVGVARSEGMGGFDLSIGYGLGGLLPKVFVLLELVIGGGGMGRVGLLVFALFKVILIHVFIFFKLVLITFKLHSYFYSLIHLLIF